MTVHRWDGKLECTFKGAGEKCPSQFVSRSIDTLVDHLERRNHIHTTYTPWKVKQLPFPPTTAQDYALWTVYPSRSRAELPPSQSQGAPIYRTPLGIPASAGNIGPGKSPPLFDEPFDAPFATPLLRNVSPSCRAYALAIQYCYRYFRPLLA